MKKVGPQFTTNGVNFNLWSKCKQIEQLEPQVHSHNSAEPTEIHLNLTIAKHQNFGLLSKSSS